MMPLIGGDMNRNINQDFGKLVRRKREIQNISQGQLADTVNISTNYIGDIENNRKKVSLEIAYKILKALDIDLYQLLPLEQKSISGKVMIKAAKDAYLHWKNLNDIICKDMDSRKVNFPEAISENIVCATLGYTRNTTESGDAICSEGKLIEIKASSNFNSDLTSFSPKTAFDKLIFLRLDMADDKAWIYDLNVNGKEFGSFPVNQSETVSDHQAQGRRPRLSLIKYIEANNIQPIHKVDLKVK